MCVVVDTNLSTPHGAKLLTTGAPVLIAHSGGEAGHAAALQKGGAEIVEPGNAANGKVDLAPLLNLLGERGVNEVLVEAGPRLNGALLEQGLIDDLIVYQAASILGADARGMFADISVRSMSERYNLQLQDVRRVGDDVRSIYRMAGKN